MRVASICERVLVRDTADAAGDADADADADGMHAVGISAGTRVVVEDRA